MTEFEQRVRAETDAIAEMLVAKNKRYGNSALEPKRIFSRATPVEQLLVRIDDKLSRIATMGTSAGPDEDTVRDLIGYLVLLRLSPVDTECTQVDGIRIL